ncbi:hypothetical protein [Anaeromicropila populeti]|uniref:Uncharacterized protein n=1 Tax=Anaeromicropila populeti TaxID=37658 RepID=A0A1I6JP72_9FIRM|nr:hypothetical protein [Anaeromicropila populeti]SFR80758.1 hypothetical protein SAMN05661086_01828 [Anaeromicropila populeti]
MNKNRTKFRLLDLMFPNKKVPKDLRELYVWKQIIAEYENYTIMSVDKIKRGRWSVIPIDLICGIGYGIYLRNNRILQSVVILILVLFMLLYMRCFDLSRNETKTDVKRYKFLISIQSMIHCGILAHCIFLGCYIANKNVVVTDFEREFICVFLSVFIVVLIFYRVLCKYFVFIANLSNNPLSRPGTFVLFAITAVFSRLLIRLNILNNKTIIWVMIFAFVAFSITISYRVFIYRHLYLIYKKDN